MTRRDIASERGLRQLANLPVVPVDQHVSSKYNATSFLDPRTRYVELDNGWKKMGADHRQASNECLVRCHVQRGWKKPGFPKQAQYLSFDNDNVTGGLWCCRLTGEYCIDPKELVVSLLVPPEEAWVSGAYQWHPKRRARYIQGMSINSKARSWHVPMLATAYYMRAARNPYQWLPPDHLYHVHYASAWVHAKHYWNLSVTYEEKMILTECLKRFRTNEWMTERES